MTFSTIVWEPNANEWKQEKAINFTADARNIYVEILMAFSTKRFVRKVSTTGIPINKGIGCIQAERIYPIRLIRDDVNFSPVDLLHFINHFADQSQTSYKRVIFVTQNHGFWLDDLSGLPSLIRIKKSPIVLLVRIIFTHKIYSFVLKFNLKQGKV